jgi:hypothetical protein
MALTEKQKANGVTHPAMSGPRTDPKFLPHPSPDCQTGQRQARNQDPSLHPPQTTRKAPAPTTGAVHGSVVAHPVPGGGAAHMWEHGDA